VGEGQEGWLCQDERGACVRTTALTRALPLPCLQVTAVACLQSPLASPVPHQSTASNSRGLFKQIAGMFVEEEHLPLSSREKERTGTVLTDVASTLSLLPS